MPFGDGTGPLGQGPMTGRGLGYCSGYSRPNYAQSGWGRGWFGRGRGRGLRRWWAFQPPVPYQPSNTKEEMEMLKEEAEILRKELIDIEATIQDLKTPKKKS